MLKHPATFGFICLSFALLGGCSPKPPEAQALPASAKSVPSKAEVRKAVKPDICTAAIWGVTAFERANGRSDDQAYLDRAAWNIAQERTVHYMKAHPDATKEEVVATVTEAVKQVYQTPSLAECKSPR